jgi:hypothetical protein
MTRTGRFAAYIDKVRFIGDEADEALVDWASTTPVAAMRAQPTGEDP